MANTERGRIIATYGKESLFQPDGENSNFLVTGNRKAGKAVCGDIVFINTDENRVQQVEPRQREYIRPDFRGRPKVIAANIDTIIWLTSHTPPNDELIAARALIVSRILNLKLVIVQSKADTTPEQEPPHLLGTKALATASDIPWFKISTITEEGINALTAKVRGATALIVGQSGVGKSTLVHLLTGDDSIRTQDVSSATGHGKHTTTTAKLYRAEELDLTLIDAPGMRDIGIWEMPESEFLTAVPEITDAARNCRFNNCQHDQEPDCGVKEALESDEIPSLIYESYRDAKDKGLLLGS